MNENWLGNYRITDVNLIDVEKGLTIPGQTVLIVGDREEARSLAQPAS